MPKPKETSSGISEPAREVFENESTSIAFTDGGRGMVVIQSPSSNREAIVLMRHEVLRLHTLLSSIIGRG